MVTDLFHGLKHFNLMNVIKYSQNVAFSFKQREKKTLLPLNIVLFYFTRGTVFNLKL